MESLDFFSAFSNFSKKYDYTISFSGPYTHSVVIDFCNTLQNVVKTSTQTDTILPKIVFGISLEMLQNIQFHAAPVDSTVLGFFGLNLEGNSSRITTINYVYRDDFEKLKKKIEYINSLNEEEINALYHARRAKLAFNVSNKEGCGLLDIRRKCGMHQYIIDFHEESPDMYLVEISIHVDSSINEHLLML